MPFGIGHPPPTHQMHSTCVQGVSRIPNPQTEFNYLDSFKSYGIFSDFVVPTWSLWSHVVPIIATSSLSSPHHPHIVPTSSLSSPHCPHSPQKVPMWYPWSVVSVVSVVSTCCLCGPHIICIIPTSSRRFPHHPQPPDTHSIHPHPPGDWGPRISKNAIRFELIKIF